MAGRQLGAGRDGAEELLAVVHVTREEHGDGWRLGPQSVHQRSVQARLLDLVRGLVNELGLAVIIVTHDLAVARLLSHRVMVMKGGEVIETGLTDQVLDDPHEPYTQLLVSSILPA